MKPEQKPIVVKIADVTAQSAVPVGLNRPPTAARTHLENQADLLPFPALYSLHVARAQTEICVSSGEGNL